MKNTEIAFILDRSGSMQSMTNAAISTQSTATIIDQHDFSGDILTLIEEAENTFSRTSASA